MLYLGRKVQSTPCCTECAVWHAVSQSTPCGGAVCRVAPCSAGQRRVAPYSTIPA
eukprot:gene9309-biopygen8887